MRLLTEQELEKARAYDAILTYSRWSIFLTIFLSLCCWAYQAGVGKVW